MKHAALGISLMLALALTVSAQAQTTNTNTNTNTVTIGKPVTLAPSAQPPHATPAKPPVRVTTPAKPATPVNKKTPSASSTATGGTSNVGVTSDANSNSTSSANGGAGGQGGTASASAGSVTVNQGGYKHSAASPTAPSLYANAECSTATSGAVTTGVLGLALGVTGSDKGCEARQNFSLMASNDYPEGAMAAFCLGTDDQQAIMDAMNVDCATLTKGRVKKLKANAGFDLAAFCQEPIGDHDRWADRAKVCANVR